MNVQEIKDKYSLKEILARCGIEPNRHDFCRCPFHEGDNTASMKIYKNDSFYCFGCHKGGDQIEFVKLYHGLSFKEACKWISGEDLTKQTQAQVAIAEIRREQRRKVIYQTRSKLKEINDSFTGLWQICQTAEPFSEDWCNAMNKWNTLCYQQDELLEKLGEI